MLLLLGAALAASEPCYGHTFDNRSEGEHFWVEWPDGALPLGGSLLVLDAAEAARATYKRELGYRFTDEPVVIFVQGLGSDGVSGITQTRDCDGKPVPSITLNVGRWDEKDVLEVTAHEVAHAVQYAYMGSYADSVASWLWWMEGHASWMTPHSTEHWKYWADVARGYLEHAELPLHGDVRAYVEPETSNHLYGTTWVVEALADWAGPEAVRETWVWGADHTGSPIFFPDAVEAVGVDFDTFWADYLARQPTLQVSRPARVSPIPPIHSTGAFPATDDSSGPGGLGVQIVGFPASMGEPRSAVELSFDGDPTVDWMVVLARTKDDALQDYVAIDVTEGHAEGVLHGFHGVDGWLIASPRDITQESLAWSWSADLIRDPGPMDDTVFLVETKGKGCSHQGSNAGLSALPMLLWLARRRPRREFHGSIE